MDRVTAYDDDIYAWSQEQAAALRRLAETCRDLPNELDLENVAEEIEDVGKSELRTVESALELLLRHLLKVASAPGAPPVRHWRSEIVLQHRSILEEFRNSMRRNLNLDRAWRTAKVRADAALDAHGQALIPDLPEGCPFPLDELVTGEFDADRAIGRLSVEHRPALSGPGETRSA